MLLMDDNTDRFLRLLIELSVAHALAATTNAANAEPGAPPPAGRGPDLNFMAPDAFVRLVAMVVLNSGEQGLVSCRCGHPHAAAYRL